MRSKIKIVMEIFLPYIRIPLMIILLALGQIHWPQLLALGGIKPNLLLILLLGVVLSPALFSGFFWGFLMGLVLDIITGTYWGLFSLSYFTAGLLGGALKQRFYLKGWGACLGAFLLLIIVYEVVFFGLYLFLYAPEHWHQGLYRILLPEAAYTFVLGALFLGLKQIKKRPSPSPVII